MLELYCALKTGLAPCPRIKRNICQPKWISHVVNRDIKAAEDIIYQQSLSVSYQSRVSIQEVQVSVSSQISVKCKYVSFWHPKTFVGTGLIT